MFRQALLLAFLPLFAPDESGGGAPPAPAGGEAALSDDPAISILLGEGDDDFFGDDDPENDGPDAIDPDGDDELEGFDPEDPFGLGLDKPEEEAEPDAGEEKPEEKPNAVPEPAALPTELVEALRAAAPEVVAATVPDLVERVVAVETANRDMRTLQDGIEAVLQRHPGLEQVLEDLLAEPADGGERVGLLEALARHVGGVEIADADDVADPEAARQAARQKGKLDAYREQRETEAKRRSDYVDAYARQAETDFEAFAAETFAGADGKPDAGAAERFVREVRRVEQGDPATGQMVPPAERFRILYRGLNHEALVAEAVTAAEARGRAAGRADALKGRGGRNGHRPLGSGAGSAPAPSGKDPLGLGTRPGGGIDHSDF